MFRILYSVHSLIKNQNKIITFHRRRVTTVFKLYNRMSGDHPSLINSTDGVELNEIVRMLERFADIRLAEKWDNVGLLIEPATKTAIKNIMLTNDLTENVIKEAIEKRINLIISYHPPIFKPLKQITRYSFKEYIVALCLENRIAVYSPHTAWDAVHGGVSDWLADAFSQHLDTEDNKETHVLLPVVHEEMEEADTKIGMGRLVYVNEISTKDCVELVKSHTGLKNVRIALGQNKTMDTLVGVIAVVPGSGGSLLKDTNACLFVTGEMSHHDLLEANHRGVTVILTNHSDSERGFLKIMCEKLQKLLEGNVTVLVSKCDKDPIITV